MTITTRKLITRRNAHPMTHKDHFLKNPAQTV
uniref:Uncharacterized protein n=1 Tax=Octopus bimaculoides TaxID=37653 RepID=A0A0L8FPS0_OCTBM